MVKVVSRLRTPGVALAGADPPSYRGRDLRSESARIENGSRHSHNPTFEHFRYANWKLLDSLARCQHALLQLAAFQRRHCSARSAGCRVQGLAVTICDCQSEGSMQSKYKADFLEGTSQPEKRKKTKKNRLHPRIMITLFFAVLLHCIVGF